MKPTATEARILRNENGLLQEVLGEQDWSFFDELRAAFEHHDAHFAGTLLLSAISEYADALNDQRAAEPDAKQASDEIDRDHARVINAGRY